MAGCAGVAGSTSIGERCMIGAGARVLGHLSICDDARISAGTVVARSIRRAGTYTGLYPAEEHASWKRNAAALRRLGRTNKGQGAVKRKGKGRRHD
jgi:UDP-3-O-[3-hydroxymyristoyl] glucosamine N-acyltransferase